MPPRAPAGHDIIVIGASSGGVDALLQLVQALPANLPAAFFAVIHLSTTWNSRIPEILSKSTGLRCGFARDGDAIEHGTLLVAPADQHLMLKNEQVQLSTGPRENFWRPAIDVLFRSAAVAHGSRVVGVILSGTLDDGTAGLRAVATCGGVTLVQDPENASYPEMPKSALLHVPGARALPIKSIAAEIGRLAAEAPGPSPAVPAHLLREARAVESAAKASVIETQLGDLTIHTCPSCGGPLSAQPDSPGNFRCLVGHAFGIASLEEGTRREIEGSLWSAIRLFEQRSHLNRSVASTERSKGRPRSAEMYLKRAAESTGHARWLQELVLSLPETEPEPERDEQEPGKGRAKSR